MKKLLISTQRRKIDFLYLLKMHGVRNWWSSTNCKQKKNIKGYLS